MMIYLLERFLRHGKQKKHTYSEFLVFFGVVYADIEPMWVSDCLLCSNEFKIQNLCIPQFGLSTQQPDRK